ncbi:hypothetical protein AVEN_77044-1, partial [Araneus ventricosus]
MKESFVGNPATSHWQEMAVKTEGLQLHYTVTNIVRSMLDNDALLNEYSRNSNHRYPKKSSNLHKLATQADTKSLILTAIARTKELSVLKLTNSQCEQDFKEIHSLL